MIGEIANYDEITDDELEGELEEDSEELALMEEEELAKKKEAAKEKMLKERKQRYENFYSEYGKTIKLGILEDKTNRNKLASLSRWHTTRDPNGLISLDDYIKKMKSIQDQIYFFSGEDKAVLEKSPLVVGLARKGYEVLLCDDPIDEYVFNVLKEYEGKVLTFLDRILSTLEKVISRCQKMEKGKEKFRNSWLKNTNLTLNLPKKFYSKKSTT